MQTFGATVEEQVTQALRYHDFGQEVVIKVVCSPIGLAACVQLRAQGIRVLMTAVHEAKQTLLAMAADATYVTPYLSEMYRAGRDGRAEVVTMLRILRSGEANTRLFMAGLNDVATMVYLAQEGMTQVTLTPDIADQLFAQQETTAMAAFFEAASQD